MAKQLPMTVVVKEPGKLAEVRNTVLMGTCNVLQFLQGLVNGFIQAVPVGPGVSLICNEDGLAEGLPENCGHVGTLVFVRDAGEDFGSLPEDDQRRAKKWCLRYANQRHPALAAMDRGDLMGGFQLVEGQSAVDRLRMQQARQAHCRDQEWLSM